MRFKKKTLWGMGLGIVLIVAATVTFIILWGKFKERDRERERVEYEETIQTVAEKIMTCPDEKMMELYDSMYAQAANSTYTLDQGKVVEYEATPIEKKLLEMYGPYISEDWYESFVIHFETEFMMYSTATGYESKIDHIEFEQSKTTPTNFSFTIYLSYGQIKGEKKDIEIKGSAQMAEEDGKIAYIQFLTDRDFMLEFRNANAGQ
ncbi:MAG: hypothetical protein WBI07_10890 [Mobilitalea sp.]